ncbi:hypothetical protein L0222_31415 [bacterium]|nr:hypothetical protein [bacterium]MCI0606066.1 hypothetical protein [bacterium]
MFGAKIVVHYQNGRVLKGFSPDFSSNRSLFHVIPQDSTESFHRIPVLQSELKAVFFVKDFQGNPTYNEVKEFNSSGPVSGQRVRVHFKDGEILVGTTQIYDLDRHGFFLIPADPASNNNGCFVIVAATKEIVFL